MNMTSEDIAINGNEFEYMGETYDCSRAIKRDIEHIIDEANKSHKDSFEELYDKDTLTPEKVRVYMVNDEPIYAMVLYTINYRVGTTKRTACGDYYPISRVFGGKPSLFPHLFQGSICW